MRTLTLWLSLAGSPSFTLGRCFSNRSPACPGCRRPTVRTPSPLWRPEAPNTQTNAWRILPSSPAISFFAGRAHGSSRAMTLPDCVVCSPGFSPMGMCGDIKSRNSARENGKSRKKHCTLTNLRTAHAEKWCQDLLPNTFSSKPGKHEICTRTEGCTKRVASGVKSHSVIPKIVSHLGRHGRICIPPWAGGVFGRRPYRSQSLPKSVHGTRVGAHRSQSLPKSVHGTRVGAHRSQSLPKSMHGTRVGAHRSQSLPKSVHGTRVGAHCSQPLPKSVHGTRVGANRSQSLPKSVCTAQIGSAPIAHIFAEERARCSGRRPSPSILSFAEERALPRCTRARAGLIEHHCLPGVFRNVLCRNVPLCGAQDLYAALGWRITVH